MWRTLRRSCTEASCGCSKCGLWLRDYELSAPKAGGPLALRTWGWGEWRGLSLPSSETGEVKRLGVATQWLEPVILGACTARTVTTTLPHLILPPWLWRKESLSQNIYITVVKWLQCNIDNYCWSKQIDNFLSRMWVAFSWSRIWSNFGLKQSFVAPVSASAFDNYFRFSIISWVPFKVPPPQMIFDISQNLFLSMFYLQSDIIYWRIFLYYYS